MASKRKRMDLSGRKTTAAPSTRAAWSRPNSENGGAASADTSRNLHIAATRGGCFRGTARCAERRWLPMVTDAERREVARRLRDCAMDSGVALDDWEIDRMIGCLEAKGDNKLSDLIDPAESGHNQDKNGTCRDETGQCPKAARNCSEPTRNCDREELIRLALELDQKSLELLKTNDLDSNRKRRGMRRAHVSDLMAASSRIRDALGVENG